MTESEWVMVFMFGLPLGVVIRYLFILLLCWLMRHLGRNRKSYTIGYPEFPAL